MCKFLLADGSSKIGGFIQDDQGMHEILSSELAYNREGQASQIRIDAEGLSTLILDAGPTDAGWWLTFTKPNSKAPVWTEYHQLCSFDGGSSGKGYGAVPFSILRRLS